MILVRTSNGLMTSNNIRAVKPGIVGTASVPWQDNETISDCFIQYPLTHVNIIAVMMALGVMAERNPDVFIGSFRVLPERWQRGILP